MMKKLFMEIVKFNLKLIHLRKNVCLEGLDDIALSLKKSDKIENFEKI